MRTRPNHALQRTAPPSLSLGSLGVLAPLPTMQQPPLNSPGSLRRRRRALGGGSVALRSRSRAPGGGSVALQSRSRALGEVPYRYGGVPERPAEPPYRCGAVPEHFAGFRIVTETFPSARRSCRSGLSSVFGSFGLFLHVSTESNRTPNHALQRTGAAVTPAASGLRLSPTTQRSRQPRPSLSLGSLAVFARSL